MSSFPYLKPYRTYVEPGPGGAPSSGQVDVLPTGRNFYGLDERALPTKIAYQLGIALADQVITRLYFK